MLRGSVALQADHETCEYCQSACNMHARALQNLRVGHIACLALPSMNAPASKLHPGQGLASMPLGCQCLCGLPPAHSLSPEIWPAALTCSSLPDVLGPLLLPCMNVHMVHCQVLRLEEPLWEPCYKPCVWGGQLKWIQVYCPRAGPVQLSC